MGNVRVMTIDEPCPLLVRGPDGRTWEYQSIRPAPDATNVITASVSLAPVVMLASAGSMISTGAGLAAGSVSTGSIGGISGDLGRGGSVVGEDNAEGRSAVVVVAVVGAESSSGAVI